MKLHLAGLSGLNAFTGYGPGYVLINGQRHDRSVIVLPREPIADWAVPTFESLSAELVAPLAALGAEVVLIGTGSALRFPRPEVLRPLVEARVGFEIMDVQAACRTYNILMAEERRVAAALVLG